MTTLYNCEMSRNNVHEWIPLKMQDGFKNYNTELHKIIDSLHLPLDINVFGTSVATLSVQWLWSAIIVSTVKNVNSVKKSPQYLHTRYQTSHIIYVMRWIHNFLSSGISWTHFAINQKLRWQIFFIGNMNTNF